MITRIAGVTAGALLASACVPHADASEPASSSSASKRECFFLSQISGYNYAGRNKIHVSVGPKETYEFETLGPCPDLDYGEHIAFDTATPGTICRGIDVDLIVPSDIGPRRCPVKMIRKLSDEEK